MTKGKRSQATAGRLREELATAGRLTASNQRTINNLVAENSRLKLLVEQHQADTLPAIVAERLRADRASADGADRVQTERSYWVDLIAASKASVVRMARACSDGDVGQSVIYDMPGLEALAEMFGKDWADTLPGSNRTLRRNGSSGAEARKAQRRNEQRYGIPADIPHLDSGWQKGIAAVDLARQRREAMAETVPVAVPI